MSCAMARPFVRDAEKLKPRSVALSDEIWAKLESIAQSRGVSISSLVCEAAEAKVKRWKFAKEAAR